LNRLSKRKQFVAKAENNPSTGSLTKKVEILAGDDVDTFADE
jgi:hypothetical protein